MGSRCGEQGLPAGPGSRQGQGGLQQPLVILGKQLIPAMSQAPGSALPMPHSHSPGSCPWACHLFPHLRFLGGKVGVNGAGPAPRQVSGVAQGGREETGEPAAPKATSVCAAGGTGEDMRRTN